MGDDNIVNEVTEEITKSMEMMGLPSCTGKIWAVLYFKGEMGQDDLKKEAGCSLSSVSQSLNFLEKVGLIFLSGKKGRKNIYSAKLSLQKNKRAQMENLLRFYLEPMCDFLNSKASEAGSKELKNKINELKGLYSKMSNFIKGVLKTAFGKESRKQ